MAPLIYDEASDAALHRFLSFLRLLMCVHPRVGADEYASHLGHRSAMGLLPGWNAVHRAGDADAPVVYVFIGEEFGRSTRERPDVPDDEIRSVFEDDLPPFEECFAWQQVMDLAGLLTDSPSSTIDPDWIQERLDSLRSLAEMPLRGHDESVDTRIENALAGIRDAVNAPDVSLLAFQDPVAQVIDDLLDFRMTLTQAYNVVSALLARYAIKVPSPLDVTGPAARIREQVDHLIGLATLIDRDRHQYDLGSYEQLSYLGLLWSGVCVVLAEQMSSRSEPEELSRWLERRALYAEEKAVHYLQPAMMHPTSWAPFGMLEYRTARRVGIVNTYGLYAGAGTVAPGRVTPEDVWPRICAYSDAHESVQRNHTAFEGFISPGLASHLSEFALTMRLGQSEP